MSDTTRRRIWMLALSGVAALTLPVAVYHATLWTLAPAGMTPDDVSDARTASVMIGFFAVVGWVVNLAIVLSELDNG